MLGNHPEPACLVIADISGYTGFLAGAELDHAQDILADLMATVVVSLRPTFRLAKLEGDAAFTYMLAEAVDAAMLQDTVERCYFAFRRRLRDIDHASTCDCNACILVPSLDLKIVAHHGRIVRQRIAGREELVGSDVIVVHRLLKNHVEEVVGARAYAMYTDACTRAMGLDDPAAAGLVGHSETFEGVGEIAGWVRDLEAAWQDRLASQRVVVEPPDAARTYAASFPAPQSVVWEYVTSPIRRPSWQQGVSVVEEQPAQPGRRGTGTVNHCMHGKDAIVEEVLDWRPYDYVTYRAQLPVPDTPPLLETYLFEDDGAGGTRVEMRYARPKAARQRALMDGMLPELDRLITAALEALRPPIDAEMASRRAAAAEAGPEPAPAESAGRNLTQPIARTA